MGAHVSAIVG